MFIDRELAGRSVSFIVGEMEAEVGGFVPESYMPKLKASGIDPSSGRKVTTIEKK